jgi:hypothetical protein
LLASRGVLTPTSLAAMRADESSELDEITDLLHEAAH